MASKISASLVLFLTFNILFFTLTTACGNGCSSSPQPKPKHKPSHSSCGIDTIKLGVCANVLKNLLKIELGTPPVKPCCSLIDGLVDFEAAVCVCTAIKAQVLGIKLNVPVSLNLLLNVCGKKTPSGFICA